MERSSAATPLINGRFLVLDGLGRGGMGRVFRAFDRDRERTVAIKAPLDERPAGPDHPMADEYRAWAGLSHRNVVRVLDLERARHGPLAPGTPFLVLERAHGRPAHRALPAGRGEEETLRTFARESLLALAHVHDAGLVHRDLKPGNLLTTRRRGEVEVKLTDFGLATEIGTRDEPGCISGSLPYLSPEAILGEPVDGRSDLYGLGILLDLLSAGSFPFDAGRPGEVLRWHLSTDPADPGRSRRDLGERWRRFVRRMTAFDPADRPRTARDALRMLGVRTGSVRRPTVGRGDLASLRLAFDAVRLGGVRLHASPAGETGAACVREARLLARVHAADYHEIGSPRSARDSMPLAPTIHRLLADAHPDIDGVIRRHRLGEGLALERLGEIAVCRRASDGRIGARGPDAVGRVASGVVALLLESGRRRPCVLVVRRGALGDPLTRAVLRRLEAAGDGLGAPRRGAPALLVIHPRRGSDGSGLRPAAG